LLNPNISLVENAVLVKQIDDRYNSFVMMKKMISTISYHC